jgi:formate hydrogenlyase transcriptional activator
VARSEFRGDLYYRLNVFPISLPPLRERREDIPALVEHFVGIFSRRMRRHIRHVPAETLAAFLSYAWPGNIRELQNLIERAVILAQDGELPNPLPTSAVPIAPSPSTEMMSANAEPAAPMTLRDSERALILQALQATGGRIGGSRGAAVRLGLNRTTLMYRMKKLGIERSLRRAAWPDNRITRERPDTERTLILHALQSTDGRIGGQEGAAEKLGLHRTTLIYRMKKLGIEKPWRQVGIAV